MAEILRIENLTKEYKMKKDSLFESTKYYDDLSQFDSKFIRLHHSPLILGSMTL